MDQKGKRSTKSTPASPETEIKTGYRTLSNVSGGITDEEFADEFLAYPATPNTEGARYQFNFLGAELEKINSAKNVRDELKRR